MSDSEPGKKAGNYAGAIWSFKLILKQAEKAWFENHNAWHTKSTWYKVSPLGKKQIGQFLPKAAKKGGLQACGRQLSNHSVRKRSISLLLEAGIPENFVTQCSSHKNLQSLSLYKSASLAHQGQMLDTLRQQIPPPNSSVHEPVFRKQQFLPVFSFQPG